MGAGVIASICFLSRAHFPHNLRGFLDPSQAYHTQRGFQSPLLIQLERFSRTLSSIPLQREGSRAHFPHNLRGFLATTQRGFQSPLPTQLERFSRTLSSIPLLNTERVPEPSHTQLERFSRTLSSIPLHREGSRALSHTT